MYKNKKISIMILVFGMLIPAQTYAAGGDTDQVDLVNSLDCVVTAYYQPIEGQQSYIKGNLAADIALNGDDTTADGTKVKVGVVAAPPEYPFGTIIDIGGFGVGKVHDRGGAIKGNRFDIWVGRGDEGLARALNWGKRTTSCTVYLPGSTIPPDVQARIGDYNLPNAALPSSYWEQKLSGGHKNLSLGETGEDVLLLRRILKENGYDVAAKGDFDALLEMGLIKFQVDKKIVIDQNAYGAGVVGPRTWQALLALQGSTKKEPSSSTEGKEKVTNALAKPTDTPLVSIALDYGAQGSEVSKLQENLRNLGYFDAPTITGYFGPSTKAAITRFQLAEGLIENANDTGAGEFDEGTRNRLLAVLLGKKTAAPIPVVVLKKGDKSPEVSILQEKLQKIGIYKGPVTDFYGEQTMQAVAAFQEQYNVQLTKVENQGVFEKKTATRLDQALGMDITINQTFIRYIEQFTLIQGTLKEGN